MRICRYFLIAVLLFTGIILPFSSAGQIRQNSMLVLLIPGLKLQDLSLYPNLNSLYQESAVGLMNAVGGDHKLPGSYLTLSSGSKCVSPNEESILGLQKSESINGIGAVELYERYLGKSAHGYEVMFPYFNGIVDTNSSYSQPGLLAGTLASSGIPLLFIGNQDLPGLISRPGALIAIDSEGRIKEGYVDQRTYVVSEFSPTFFTTNYSFFYDKTAGFFQNKSGIVILDLGDLSRLDCLYKNLVSGVYDNSRKVLMQEIDSFLGRVSALVKENNCALLIITPFPDYNDSRQGNMLTPAIYHTYDDVKGLLSSPSTKRPGIITNLDIAPTILEYTGITKSREFLGSPVKILPHTDPLLYLELIQKEILANHLQRPYILKSYVVLQIIVVLSTVLFIFLRRPVLRWANLFLLTLPAGPLLFLLLPLFPSDNVVIRAALLFASGGFIVFLLMKKLSIIKYLSFLYLLTTAFIAGDLLWGAPLMKSSLLGYDPISGARYYGLGNEYMGVLLGSSLIGLTLLAEILVRRYPRYQKSFIPIILILFFMLICLVASPRWGANVGGTISFLGSFFFLSLLLYGIKFDFKTVILVFSCFCIFLVLLFYFDLRRPVELQSHIGQTARLIRENGPDSLFPIFERKVSMNIKLIHYSLWTRVFLTFLAATAFVFYRPPGLMKKIFINYPFLRAGSIAGIGGSFIALAVNDSGIVAAATSMIFIAPALLFLVVERILNVKE